MRQAAFFQHLRKPYKFVASPAIDALAEDTYNLESFLTWGR
jgi:hypothetical protein